MPEEVTYDAESQLIRVRSWGKCTIQDWNASKAQVLDLHSCHGINKLLVDVREQQATPGISAIYQFGADWPREIRCVILVGEGTQAEQEFLETVARNRGKPMKVFSAEEEAMKWLNE